MVLLAAVEKAVVTYLVHFSLADRSQHKVVGLRSASLEQRILLCHVEVAFSKTPHQGRKNYGVN